MKPYLIFIMVIPILIHNQGTNITTNKNLVDSIDENYYKYVKSIEFYPERFYWGSQYVYGRMYTFWDSYHNCFNGKIWTITDKKTLMHELCHFRWFCEKKRDINNETFAEECWR